MRIPAKIGHRYTGKSRLVIFQSVSPRPKRKLKSDTSTLAPIWNICMMKSTPSNERSSPIRISQSLPRKIPNVGYILSEISRKIS